MQERKKYIVKYSKSFVYQKKKKKRGIVINGKVIIITRNTNIVTKHEATGGGHYAGNDDNRCDLGLKLRGATTCWTESSGHGCVCLCYISNGLFWTNPNKQRFREKKKNGV